MVFWNGNIAKRLVGGISFPKFTLVFCGSIKECLLGASDSMNILLLHFSSWRMMQYHCQQICQGSLLFHQCYHPTSL